MIRCECLGVAVPNPYSITRLAIQLKRPWSARSPSDLTKVGSCALASSQMNARAGRLSVRRVRRHVRQAPSLEPTQGPTQVSIPPTRTRRTDPALAAASTTPGRSRSSVRRRAWLQAGWRWTTMFRASRADQAADNSSARPTPPAGRAPRPASLRLESYAPACTSPSRSSKASAPHTNSGDTSGRNASTICGPERVPSTLFNTRLKAAPRNTRTRESSTSNNCPSPSTTCVKRGLNRSGRRSITALTGEPPDEQEAASCDRP